MYIYIEGNIGSGKTTLCNRLKKDGYIVYNEPVEDWISSGKLQAFYDGKISPFEFQKYITCSMYDRQKEAIRENDNIDVPIVFERSVYSSSLFAHVSKQQNAMNYSEWELLDRIIDALHKEGQHIYIKTDYEVCRDRIESRNRGEETNISLDYLKSLEQVHDEILKPHYTVNGNKSIDEIHTDTIQIIQSILRN